MLTAPSIQLEAILPLQEHARLIMTWRNDPKTLRMSFHSEKKVWPAFWHEFITDYLCWADLPPLFAIVEGQRVAFLRFEPVAHPYSGHRRCCDISINVAPSWRGKKVGRALLILAQQWMALRGYDDILAEIKKNNKASIKAFEYAGFHHLDLIDKTIGDSGQKVPIVRMIAPLTAKTTFPKEEVYVIAEAGSNWRMGSFDKDVALSKALIDAAKEGGADAIKFQVFRPETVYAPGAGQSDYLTKLGITQDIEQLFKDLSMPYDMIPIIQEYALSCGIDFIVSSFSIDDFDAVDPFVAAHKIASYELGHIHLLERAAKSQKPLILSTGAATCDEVAWSLNYYRRCGGSDIALMQCTGCYPAAAASLNLQAITALQQRFKVAVGLSDHSRDPVVAPVAAVALGASIIEKHFTLSNELPGPDHRFAITPPELKQMVAAIRSAEKMRGSGIKEPLPDEQELRHFCVRGIQALKTIDAGETLREGDNIAILRAGHNRRGIHPKYMGDLEGRKALHSLAAGEGLQRGDWHVDDSSSAPLQGLLVDLDGTVANSLPFLFRHFQRFMKQHDVDGSWDAFASFIGPSLPEIMAAIKEKYSLKGSVDDLLKTYLSETERLYLQEVEPFPEVKEIFLKAKNEWKMKLAIVTSAPRTMAQAFLDKHHLLPLIDALISSDDVAKGKPDPSPYHEALCKLQLNTDHAVAIEDSPQGVVSSTTAGLYTLWFLANQKLYPTAHPPPSTEIVDSWAAIEQWLQKQVRQ